MQHQGESTQIFVSNNNLSILQISDYIIHQMRYQRSTGLDPIPIRNSGYQNFENMATAEPSIEAFKRAESSVKEFIKKSLADSKSLRFHQCYFNPISCFRR